MNWRILTITLFLSMATIVSFGKKKDKKAKIEVDTTVYKSDMPAYVIYDSTGAQVSYKSMIEGLAQHQICLFGELHDDFIAHWLEKIVTEDLHEIKGSNMILGGEMWEADQQLLMDEFINTEFVDKKMYLESAKNWPNFEDYKPLLGIAIRNNLKFVCSNIPRRYARVIYTMGEEYLDSLDERAYQYLPPLPIHWDLEQPGYKQMGSIFAPDSTAGHGKTANPMANYKGTNLVKAQAIKDATMAYNILKFWEEGKFLLHYNGVYHSKNHDGICFYLRHYKPDVDIVTISIGRQKDVLKLHPMNNTADFNIIVPDNLPTTY